MPKLNVAYISKNGGDSLVSFVKTHKEHIDGNLFFYYGGAIPTHMDNTGVLKSKKIRIISFIKQRLNIASKFSEKELLFLNSLKKNKTQVVYVDFGTIASEILPVCEYLQIPIIVAFLGFDISRRDVLVRYEKKYRKLLQYCSKALVVSKSMIPQLLKFGCDKTKIIWSPYPPESNFRNIVPTFESSNFFMMGRFVNKKAPYYSILAFHKVVLKHKNAKLRIAGTGPLLEVCINLVKHFHLEKNVTFLKNITPSQSENEFKNAIAFVQHSIIAEDGDQEGTPVSILEASLAGLPVISTNHAGIPDVIINNKSGFIIEEHDVDEMFKKMEYCIENKNEARKMGQFGKEFISANFSIEKHMDIVNDIINNSACI